MKLPIGIQDFEKIRTDEYYKKRPCVRMVGLIFKLF